VSTKVNGETRERLGQSAKPSAAVCGQAGRGATVAGRRRAGAAEKNVGIFRLPGFVADRGPICFSSGSLPRFFPHVRDPSISLSLSPVSVFLYVQFRVSVFGDLQLSQQHRTRFHIDPNLPSLSCMQLLRSPLVVGYQISQYQSFFSLVFWVFFFWLLLVVVAVVDFLRPLVEAPCVRYGVKRHRWLKL
jgi:hypothetical protein